MTVPFRVALGENSVLPGLAKRLSGKGEVRPPFTFLLWGLIGAGLALTFPPSPFGWLAPLPLALLFRAVAHTSPWRAFHITFAFAFGFFALHLFWLPSSLSGMLGPGVAVLAAVLVAVLALSWAGSAVLTRCLLGRFTLWGLPLVWVLLDFTRSLGPFAFTWGSLGYAFAETPFVQVADLGGVALVGLLVGLAASALASGQRTGLMAGGLLLLLAGGYALSRPPSSAGDRQVLLVQGDIDPRGKVTERRADELNVYANLTQQGLMPEPLALVIWPETAAPSAPTGMDVAPTLTALNVPLLIGAPTLNGGYWNSVYTFEQGHVTGRQDKIRLVPFGEYFPARAALDPLYRAVFRVLHLPSLSGTTPGTALTPLMVGGVRAGVSICYESTFPAFSRALVKRGADVLVTVSNDAWFGPSAGGEQHFQMGRLRAIETRRWWLRAGNDGVTAVVAPSGKVAARLPRGERGTLRGTFARAQATTLYVQWGEWVPPLSLLLLLGLGIRSRVMGRSG